MERNVIAEICSQWPQDFLAEWRAIARVDLLMKIDQAFGAMYNAVVLRAPAKRITRSSESID